MNAPAPTALHAALHAIFKGAGKAETQQDEKTTADHVFSMLKNGATISEICSETGLTADHIQTVLNQVSRHVVHKLDAVPDGAKAHLDAARYWSKEHAAENSGLREGVHF